MSIYVLVHGAFGGGWQFRRVAGRLQAAGHEVYRPTLTGLGERSHLLNPDITLDTHIQDIVNVLAYEDLRDVILVGKSYGGMVITGAAERVPERVRHIVYLDAVVPLNRQSLVKVLGPEVEAHMRKLVSEAGDGWRLPTFNAPDWRIANHPFKTLTQLLAVKNPAAAALPHTYIRYLNESQGPHNRMAERMAQRAKALGWQVLEIPAEHDLEESDPDRLADLLLGVV
jgi:pimeloyl-ACP methyl ester carboxylesterase